MIMMNTFLIEAAGVLACKNLAYAVHCVHCVLGTDTPFKRLAGQGNDTHTVWHE